MEIEFEVGVEKGRMEVNQRGGAGPTLHVLVFAAVGKLTYEFSHNSSTAIPQASRQVIVLSPGPRIMARTIGGIDVLFTDTNRHLENTWVEYGHKKQVLPKGWTKDEGRRPLPCDMIWEKDIEIRMRDGTKLLGDVFRPVDTENGKRVPALMPWSPYGKTGTGEWRAR